MYQFLKWSLLGLAITDIILIFMAKLTENNVLYGILLFCILGLSCETILFVWYKGELAPIAWYRKHGILGEVTLQEIKVEDIPNQYGSFTRYTLVAKGVNPATQQEQVFTRECSRKYRDNFHMGDKLTVYIHPRRSKIATIVYRIDLKSKPIHNRS